LHTSPSKDQKKTPKDVPDKKKDGQMLYLKEWWWFGSDGKILTKRAWKKMERTTSCALEHMLTENRG